MVGRRAELRQFGSLLKSTARAGRGGAVLVRGEAGLGKTRLVRVFARRARRAGFAAHVGHVLDFGASGGGALGELLLSLLRLAPDAPEEARRAAIEQAVARRRVREVDRLFLADLLDLPLGAELRTTFDAMTSAARLEGRTACLARLLRRSARRKPCLVVVEDVHWADRAKLESLASLARGARHAPYLLVMTTRPEGDPIDGAWRAATEGAALLTLDLAPLAVEEAQRLAARYLAADSAEARHCIGRAGGNPLFLEQLLLSARSGELERLPGSVQSVVLARVDRLGPPERRVIQAAAVLGQRFAPEVVAYLLDVPAISCEALVRANLLRPSAGEFSFAHALIWEGVYGALLKRRRYELHRRAAQWFATRDAVLHAEHLDRAEDAAAPAAYLAAARQQAEHYRHLAALDLIRRGLALATDALQRHQLHLLESELERELGRAKPALKAARQAHAAAGHGLERVRALIAIAEALRVRDRIAPALIRLDRAERLLGATEHPLERSRLHHLRGNLYFPLGRMGECLREHEKAMMQAKFAASIEGEVRALGGLGDALYALGRFKSAFEHFERCVAQAEAHGLGRIAVANRPMLPACASLLGRLEDNRRHGELAIQAAVRAGNRRAELVARTALSFGELDARAIDRVLKETAACLRLLKSVEAPRLHQEVLGLRSVALVRAKGRHLEATALAREAVARARRTGLSYFGPWLLAMLAFATEDAAERAAALAEGEALLAKGVLSHNLVGYYGLAIEIGIETNALDEAVRHADALEAALREEPPPRSVHQAAVARTLAAAARGGHAPTLKAELERLLEEQARTFYPFCKAALERALAALGAS
jgi:tetratricopeptide (TPR) repeat protein